MQLEKIRLPEKVLAYGEQTLEGLQFTNRTPQRGELERAVHAQQPFDLSSCCPANEDGEENVCTSYIEFVNTLLSKAGECLCGLIEYVKSLLCPVALTAEETHVSAFVNKWANRPVSSKDDAAEMQTDFDTFRPRSINDYGRLTAAQWARRAVAERHMDLVYLERLDIEHPYTWWEDAVTQLICKYPSHAQVKALVIESLATWLETPADEREVSKIVSDEQVVEQFMKFWADGEKNAALWKTSFNLLPEEVQEAARDAFFDAHPDLRDRIIEVPRRPIENNQLLIANDEWDRKRKIAASKDAVIFEHRLDPAVIKAVREWKPKAE
jgi:hypothetical protein